MCHRIGRPPISTMGLGRTAVSSESRVPIPPASITAFIPTRPRLFVARILTCALHEALFSRRFLARLPSHAIRVRGMLMAIATGSQDEAASETRHSKALLRLIVATVIAIALAVAYGWNEMSPEDYALRKDDM